MPIQYIWSLTKNINMFCVFRNDCCLTPTQQFNKLIFNEMMMRSALYYTNRLS